MANRHEIAKALLRINAVALSLNPPFTWVSGIRSPIYCDNRLLISHPTERNLVVNRFVDEILSMGEKPDCIAGTATSGIPFAAWVADRMNLPMCYVRAEKKAHGKGKAIEGDVHAGDNVLVIEDLISTGKSSVSVVRNLLDAGLTVTGVISIFSYEMEKANENFKTVNIAPISLETISSLLKLAVSDGTLSQKDAHVINDFRNDPQGWYKRNFPENP
ncbi:MAG: orotate phosphoribosyltransferase [Acidobacteria bacterium]|nr:MAG: orotate phosphoribosyltransferase [Acidobacteriota bacterium]